MVTSESEAPSHPHDFTFHANPAIEKDEKKKEKELERERRWKERINGDFMPPGTRLTNWARPNPDGITLVTTYQPGSLKEWACFKIRKEERLALEIRKERAWDSLPGGWLEDEVIQKAMEDEGFNDPWHSLDLHYFETADQFTIRLIGEGRKLVNEGKSTEEQCLTEAIKNMTHF